MRSFCQWMVTVGWLGVIAGCSGGGGQSGPAGAPGAATLRVAQVGHMSAVHARDFLATHGDAVVLDVRTPEEWDGELGHIEGARLIPVGELESRLSEIQGLEGQPVVVVCRSGNRSRTAAELLVGAGFREVYNLEGGMEAWRQTEAIGR